MMGCYDFLWGLRLGITNKPLRGLSGLSFKTNANKPLRGLSGLSFKTNANRDVCLSGLS